MHDSLIIDNQPDVYMLLMCYVKGGWMAEGQPRITVLSKCYALHFRMEMDVRDSHQDSG